MKSRYKLINIIIVAGLLLSGCSYFIDDKVPVEYLTEEKTDDTIKVGFSQLGSESVWRVANSESIKDSLSKEKGFSLEFNNARQKQDNQIKAIRSFIAEEVDYIIFSPVTEEGWDTVLQEAYEANIPVILADRKISTSNKNLYTAWIGSDARAEGRKAAEWLNNYLINNGRTQEEINIVVLQGTIGSSVELGRTMGFDIVSEAHPNWHILVQSSGDFTTAKGKEVMLEYLEKYDNIDVLVSQNDDMTFGAIEAMDEKGVTYGENGEVIVISFDAVSEALKLVSEGKINVDIECNPEEGEYIAEIISRLENGEIVEKETIVDEMIFTKENVDQYIDNRSY